MSQSQTVPSPTTGSEPITGAVERDRIDCALGADETSEFLGCRRCAYVPHGDTVIRTSSGQQRSVGAERHC